MRSSFISFVLLLISISSCKKSTTEPDPITPITPITFKKSTVQYKTISGVSANLLSLDIYHPSTATNSRPVVVYVHGGGWRIGDKAFQLENKRKLFESLGYVFISVNYRLSPDPAELTNASRIKFPIHNIDVASAIKWVYDNVGNYYGNANKIVIMGHSAGAHLVALSGTSQAFLPALGLTLNSIKGVASIDTEGYDVTGEMQNPNLLTGEIYENAFGTNTVDWSIASPISQVTNGASYPKFFIAKRGGATRIANADAFINKLSSVGVSVSQVNGSQYDHEGINDAIGAPGETAITEPLKAFLTSCFQ